MRKAIGLLFFWHTTVMAYTPWFTGPLLAQPAVTIEPGKVNLELFNFNIRSDAVYDSQTKIRPVYANTSNQMIPQLTIGLTSTLDIELQPVLISNYFKNKSATTIGDTMVMLGMQALKQHENSLQPDLRITLSEILPSGHYEGLSAQNYALEATGLGTYQTGIDFNFQRLLALPKDYYLNTHLSVGYLYSNAVHVDGYSSYGGTAHTNGDVKPGSVYTFDLAEELSLSQHWVVVLEGFYQYQDSDRFYGDYGNTDINFRKKTRQEIKEALSRLMPSKHNISSLFLELPKVGNSVVNMLSFAPALEYNFSKEFGVILGTWFSFYGKNTPDFGSVALGINIFL